ncbi:MAG: hypothetical protein B6226_01305 [Candidatus Cloacimonetes bacterium 4572_65]|nr:MAG: hypothetical protein B6226_01305 [Candidatus Cloacimonetes bacterium 4572_65]
MKQFEKQLEELVIPEIEDKLLKYDLKERLENHYFKRNFKVAFQLAFSSSIVLVIALGIMVLRPSIATDLNRTIVKGETEESIVQDVESYQQYKGFEGLSELSNNSTSSDIVTPQIENVNDTSIKTINYLKPDDFEEGKYYLIHKYKSEDEKGIILINEINNSSSNRNPIKKM